MKTIRLQFQLTRRRLLQGGATLALSSLVPGCSSPAAPSSSQTVVPPTTTPVSQPVPSGPLTASTLSVSTSTIGAIGNGFAGLGYEKQTLSGPTFSASNTNLIGLFKLLGGANGSVLRIGGDSVDTTVWTPNGAGQTVGQTAPSDLAAFAAFVKATGWKCIYGLNLQGSASGATTPVLAAAEAVAAVAALGSSLVGIELGNEPDNWNTTYTTAVPWNLTNYEAAWNTYRNAIVAAVPSVAFVGPATAANVSTWTVPFAQTENKTSQQLNLVTTHYYIANGMAAPIPTVLDLMEWSVPNSTSISISHFISNTLAPLKTYTAQSGVPWRLGECNSYYDGGAFGVSDAYATSLWVLDFLFTMAQYGSSGGNFQGGGNNRGYTPIADSNGVVLEARPVFYGLVFFTLAGTGTLYNCTLNAGSLNANAYAIKTPTGGLNLILNNKDLAQNLQLTIQLPQAANSASLIELTQLTSGFGGPSLSATEGVTIQGASIGLNGSFSPGVAYNLTANGTQLSCYVPALSAVLIQIT